MKMNVIGPSQKSIRLHCVSCMTGNAEKSNEDIFFTAPKYSVIQFGLVDKVLQHVQPILQYNKKNSLWTTTIKDSDFHMQNKRNYAFRAWFHEWLNVQDTAAKYYCFMPHFKCQLDTETTLLWLWGGVAGNGHRSLRADAIEIPCDEGES